MKPASIPLVVLAVLGIPAISAFGNDTDTSIAAILKVGPEGEGNLNAGKAWRALQKADADALPKLLAAMDNASPLATNWLKGAIDVIVGRELAAGNELPLGSIGEFLLDTRHHPRARRLAFDLINRVDPDSGRKLVPGMLNDPAVELRRDAVARLIEEADKLSGEGKKNAAILLHRQALNAARDVDQVEKITKSLTENGETVDLPEHFGFLMHWKVIGPFHNTERKGFNTEFPPEKDLNLQGECEGLNGETVKWSELVTSDKFGMVDINKPYGQLKEVTAYAVTEFNSPEARPAQIRLGCKNAWKVWLNGKLVFGRDEYHRGMRIDQYQLPVRLEKGKNTILVKICQNEQKERWTVEWQFQLRVCDATGTAILATDRPPTPVANEEGDGEGKPGRRRGRRSDR